MSSWQPGETVALRGMLNQRPCYIQSALVVKDTPAEVALLLLPGAECAAPSGYIHKKHGDHSGWQRWQEALSGDWNLEKYHWRTNRFLILLEPDKFYATILIWDHASADFQCYYINFQLPYTRSQCGFDTYDLELDLLIDPDFQWHWKDIEDYQQGIQLGAIRPEWVRGIEQAKKELFERIDKRLYPLNTAWLNWLPEKTWVPPQLPPGWDNQQPDEQGPLSPPLEPEQSLVCGRKMTIPPENYYPAEYHGRPIHFCTEFCLETFRADPERFYLAHSKRKDGQN